MASLRALPLLVLLLACSGDPADVAGTYTVAVTSGPNECMLPMWNEGDSTRGIDMLVSQSGTSASADIRGLTGTYLDFVLGSSVFSGDVDGEDLELLLIGTAEQTAPGCTYTIDAEVDATLDGDVLTGTITYRPNPVMGTCGILESCRNVQQFNGTRPPTP